MFITVRYEEYHNDNNFTHYKKDFSNLDHLKIWMKDQMNTTDLQKWITFSYQYPYIRLQPDGPGWSRKIHLIEDNDGIIFSDGDHTGGQSHVADCVKKWMDEFKKELENPTYNFVNK